MLDSGAFYRVTAYAADSAGTAASMTRNSARALARRLDLEFRPAADGLTEVLLEGEDISDRHTHGTAVVPWPRKWRQ
jgi:cytidylate kinase